MAPLLISHGLLIPAVTVLRRAWSLAVLHAASGQAQKITAGNCRCTETSCRVA